MLNNLDFLGVGQKWPPIKEGERISKYKLNRNLYRNNKKDLPSKWTTILTNEQVKRVKVALNWYRRLPNLWASLLVGDPPTFRAGELGGLEQETLENIVNDNELAMKVYQGCVDISRFGVGLLKLRYDGREIIDVTIPDIWFPVVSPDNIKEFTHHVLGWTFKDGDNKFLRVEIHEVGRIENRLYLLNKGKIQKRMKLEAVERYKDLDEVTNTGVNDFLVYPLQNIAMSDEVLACDDYEDIHDIIIEMNKRVSQIAYILDKHSDPSMYGPSYAVDSELDKEYDGVNNDDMFYKGDPIDDDGIVDNRSNTSGSDNNTANLGGKYLPLDKEDVTPGYLEWNSKLEAAFKEIDVLLEQLYVITETSGVAFGQLKSGLAESGTALRRLMMAPLSKVKRIRLSVDGTLKRVIKNSSKLKVNMGESNVAEISNIKITWKDGLPDDEKESTEIRSSRYTSGIASLEEIKREEGYEGQALKDIIEQINNVNKQN